jgi:hypothetical protein
MSDKRMFDIYEHNKFLFSIAATSRRDAESRAFKKLGMFTRETGEVIEKDETRY